MSNNLENLSGEELAQKVVSIGENATATRGGGVASLEALHELLGVVAEICRRLSLNKGIGAKDADQ